MNENYDEYEQGEAVKKWLLDNVGSIVIGIGLGLAGLFGWQYWQDRQAEKKVEAAEALATLLAEDSAGEVADLDRFLEQVDSTAHATMAALHLSGKAMENGEPEQAAALLERVANKGEPEEIRLIAALRLARVKLDLGQLEQVEPWLNKLSGTAFAGLAANVRGDLLLQRGDKAGARAAYQQALNEINGGNLGWIQMKLDDLALAPAEGS